MLQKVECVMNPLRQMITTILTMVDGVRVVVLDSRDLISPYVLREQLSAKWRERVYF
jgi:hypothetical protein